MTVTIPGSGRCYGKAIVRGTDVIENGRITFIPDDRRLPPRDVGKVQIPDGYIALPNGNLQRRQPA